MNERCTNGASHVKVKNGVDVTKITKVLETCPRDRRDTTREGNMRVRNETKVVSTGSRRDGVTSENKCRIMDFI